MDRIIILIDMDCFYVQVEQKLAPEHQNQPCAVVQYKNFKGGGIIAVNYEARNFGVKRGGMHGDDARKLCPSIHLFQVPETRGKADLTKYRDASAQIFEVLKRFSSVIEHASIDEAYLDVTKEIDQWLAESGDSPRFSVSDLPSTFVEGFCSLEDECGVRTWLETSFAWDHVSKRLALAAILCERIRLSILDETGFRCSAGIATNKILAKLACSIHKPNKQTLVLPSAVTQLLANVPIFKIRNFGGHLGGEISSRFQISTMGELATIAKDKLVSEFGEKNGTRIFDVARGVDHEAVVSRQVVKSVGCGKNFRGPEALTSRSKIMFWLKQMAEELEERLNRDRSQNNRVAELLTVGALFSEPDNGGTVRHNTRCVRLQSYCAKMMASSGYKALCKLGKPSRGGDGEDSDYWWPPIINLSLTASKFSTATVSNGSSIKSLFQNQQQDNGDDRAQKSTPLLAKKRKSVSFLARQKQLRQVAATTNHSNEDHCEISWADEARPNGDDLMSPDKEEHLMNGDDQDQEGDDDPDSSQTDGEVGESVASSKALKQQRNFERVSLSIRSLIRNTLSTASDGEKTAPEPKPSKPDSTSSTTSSAPSGGFFRRKQLEREQQQAPSSSSSAAAALASASSKTPEPIVIDLDDETPSTSSAEHVSKRQYYCSVDAASVDMEMLRQMPIEIQREYAAALGLSLKDDGTNNRMNGSSSSSMVQLNGIRPVGANNNNNNNRKRPLGSLANSSNKAGGKVTKGGKKPASGRPSSQNKLPAITIDDFFR